MKLSSASLLLLALGASAGLHAAGTAGKITVDQVSSRPTPPGTTVGVVYLVIANRDTQPDQLIGLRSPLAASAELHQTRVVDGLAQMRAVAVLNCPPGAVTRIEAGGLHIMLSGLRSPLTPGMRFPLILRFRHAGDLAVEVAVH